jgi:uncharacterized membrane protein
MLLFARFALARHDAFESNAYDYAFFDQIIWNTAHGRFFDTSFLSYNFLGQHFEPVLLLYALGYRAGAGIDSLALTQAWSAGAAAVPLYYAGRRATGSGVCALMLALAFLLSAPLHSALDFDFHPEMLGFFFVFVALYFVVAGRPGAAIGALLPLLALKEDMALILLAFAVLLFTRGRRRPAAILAGVAVAYVCVIVLVAMPAIRGGPGDLTERYAYLSADSTVWTLAPHVAWRAVVGTADALPAIARVEGSLGFIAVLSPAGVVAAAPNIALAALSDHPQQSALELHYVMAPLTLSWVAGVLGLQAIAGVRPRAGSPESAGGAAQGAQDAAAPWRRIAVMGLAAVALAGATITFAADSPYAPWAARSHPDAAHQRVIREALTLVPADAAVSAQGTLLPHLSQREEAYEFPDVRDAADVVVDAALPVTSQARAAGYDDAIAGLKERGFEEVFARDGVRVYRRAR